MTSLAKVGSVDGAALAAAEDAAKSAKTGGAPICVQDDEPEGDRVNKRVEKLLMDIETGKVKTTVYTFDEYMRYLDGMRDG